VKRKRRKRTSANVPAKGRLRDIADRLWALAVREDWLCRCAVCGRRKTESHHMVPRQHYATRYLLENGIALCSTHHQFDPNISPHQNAAGWMAWMKEHHPFRAQWYLENCCPQFDGITNAAYYIEQIQRLREYVDPDDFVRIVGVRFAAYLDELRERT